MPKLRLPAWKLGYLAGFLDGEGSLKLYYRHRQNSVDAGVEFTNTNYTSLDRMRQWLNSCGFTTRLNDVHPASGIRRASYRLVVNRWGDVYGILKGLMPYLSIKKERSAILLRLASIKVLNYRDHSRRKPRVVASERRAYNEFIQTAPRLNAQRLRKNFWK